MVKRFVDGIVRDLTAEEQAEYDARQTAWENASADRKLAKIKEIRLQKLIETDWWVLRGDITDAQKLYRKNLRDIPQDYTDEASYDLLLARDPDTKELTHSIWSKP
jgi:hypothetical protein